MGLAWIQWSTAQAQPGLNVKILAWRAREGTQIHALSHMSTCPNLLSYSVLNVNPFCYILKASHQHHKLWDGLGLGLFFFMTGRAQASHFWPSRARASILEVGRPGPTWAWIFLSQAWPEPSSALTSLSQDNDFFFLTFPCQICIIQW